MNKKIIIGIIAAIVVIGGTVGTVLGVQAYNTNKEYEQLANNVTECEKMIQNMNYFYTEETEEAKQLKQRDLDKLKTYSDKIADKNLTDDEKTEFGEFVKIVNQHWDDDTTKTKAQFDNVQASKDSHTDEGYYTDEFNNEWNGYVNQFNDLYGKQEYFNAFQVVLTMNNKLNEYVANKDAENNAKAEVEKQQQEAAQAGSKKNGGSSNSSSSKNSANTASNSVSSSSSENDTNSANNIPSDAERATQNQAIKRQMEDIINSKIQDAQNNGTQTRITGPDGEVIFQNF